MPSTRVDEQPEHQPPHAASRLRASDAMPKVKQVVSSISVSMNAEPILNSVQARGRRRWRQASSHRSRTAARKPLHRSSGRPRSRTRLSRLVPELMRVVRQVQPGVTALRIYAIHSASPSFAAVSRADEGRVSRQRHSQPLSVNRFDLRGRHDPIDCRVRRSERSRSRSQ